MTIDMLAEVVLSADGNRKRTEATACLADAGAAAFRGLHPEFDDGFSDDEPRAIDLLIGAGQHPYPVSIGWCDASGEDDPGQIRNFVKEACRVLGLTAPTWDEGDADAEGDDPAGLLRAADHALATVGQRLLMIDLDSDTYLFAPVAEDDLARLDGEEGEGFVLSDVERMLHPRGVPLRRGPLMEKEINS